MSDPGNVNGGQIDDPVVNSAVVGVDMLSGDGYDPENPPTGEQRDPPPPEGDASGSNATGAFDPGAHTVDAVEDYVEAHPDEAAAVLAAEQSGKNRTTLVAWLEDFEA